MDEINGKEVKSFVKGIIHGSQYLAFFGDLRIY
jgi:hypothetical protein